MASVSLEDLPAELIITILYSLASPKALRSLIQASPRCYKIFLRSRSQILLAVLREALQPEIKSLVLLVHEAYSLPAFGALLPSDLYWNRPDSVQTFMSKFSQDHESDGHESYGTSPHFVVRQLQTVSMMEYFVEDYSNWVSHHLYASRPPAVGARTAMGMLPPPQAYRGLSDVERFRLLRAFLRFEIFCAAMHAAGGHERSLSASHPTRLTNDRFLNILQPWEREELVCVVDYLTVRVEDIFDELELDYVEQMIEKSLSGDLDHHMAAAGDSSEETTGDDSADDEADDSSLSHPSSPDPTLPVHNTDSGQPRVQINNHTTNFFTADAKQHLHAPYVTRLITLGLPFLRHLLQSGIKEQRRLVFEKLSTDGATALLVVKYWITRDPAQLLRRDGATDDDDDDESSTTVPRHSRQLTAVAGGGGARDHERMVTFDGDQVGKPNFGFLWTHGFTSTNVCRGCDYLHRRLGYVFWDQAHLAEMGLVDRSHGSATWPNRRQQLRTRRCRAHEKSALERLAEMGF